MPSPYGVAARLRVARIDELLKAYEGILTPKLLAGVLREYKDDPSDVCMYPTDKSPVATLQVCFGWVRRVGPSVWWQSIVCVLGSLCDDSISPIHYCTSSPDPRRSVFKPIICSPELRMQRDPGN